jgi:O-antigen/teichoic acid export membrane protein
MRVNNKILFSISNTVRTFEVLFISIFLSRFIDDKNALGELLQIIFISSVLITALSGLPLSLNFFYGKYDTLNEKNSLFGKFFMIIILLTLLICFLLYISAPYISSSFKNEAFADHIYVIIFYYFFKSINSIFPNYHYLKNKLNIYLLLYTLSFIALLGCFLYNYASNSFITHLVLFQLLCLEFTRLIINVFIIKRKEVGFNLKDFNKQEFIYISTISLGVIFGALNLYVDKYLIAIFLDPTDFVYYQNGAINLPFVHIITSSLFIALVPVFAELQSKNKMLELITELKDTILKCSFFLIPILVYCFFEAVPLIKFLYGNDFEISGEVFKIYILRYSLSVIAFSVFMGSIGLEKKANFIILLSAIICLVLNSTLIPIYGIKGAAWATVIASLSTIAVSFHFINKKLLLNVVNYFPIKKYFIIISLSIITYIPFYVINLCFETKWFVVMASVIYYITTLAILNSHFKMLEFKKLLKHK